MHKITKGLKKKKKGKKNKHKEEELFDAAELAAYRLEHQAAPPPTGEEAVDGEGAAAAASEPEQPPPGVDAEEWLRFRALTAGVDSVLKKTQGDLDRIKSTSFFQRKPAGSSNATTSASGVVQEPPQRPKQPDASARHNEHRWVGFEEGSRIDEPPPPPPEPEVAPPPAAPEPVAEPEPEESEEEEEEDEDIFDTSYVDVVASGEVKLAYIPDSPDKEPDEFDPFDTSIVDTVIKPCVDKKGNKLVSLGCAVDVLSGILDKEKVLNAVIPTSGVKRRVIKNTDLLLTSFDEAENQAQSSVKETAAPVVSLLDDDAPLGSPTDFQPTTLERTPEKRVEEPKEDLRDLVAEFDLIGGKPEVVVAVEDDLEDEFAALAAESVTKHDDPFSTSPSHFPLSPDVDIVLNEHQTWAEFESKRTGPPRPQQPRPLQPQSFPDHEIRALAQDLDLDDLDVDPFDTSFADNILPGRVELRLIENEILRNSTELEVNEARILSRSDSDFDFNPREGEAEVKSSVSIHITDPAGDRQEELRTLTLSHRDLLGGSTTDLSRICHEPIEPANTDEYTDYVDPFDTSVVDVLVAPGKAELKFIEKELLGETQKRRLSDPDFDPRQDAPLERPGLLDIGKQNKAVAFDLPTPSSRPDLLLVGKEEGAKVSKPLTPFYVEKNRENVFVDDDLSDVDPFDTSFASNIAPGKAELKLIESEFVSEVKRSLSDEDFDPRSAKTPSPPPVVTVRVNLGRRHSEFPHEASSNLGRRCSDFTGDKRRSPPRSLNIKGVAPPPPLSAPVRPSPPKPDLLESVVEHSVKQLTPAVEEPAEYLDPFDTSIAANLVPGKAELKLLEAELIADGGETSIKRSYTDPDFNPRDGHQHRVLAQGDRPDLLNLPTSPGAKPLTPSVEASDSVDETNYDDVDPFDTSIVSDLVPGKAELRILESELFGQ